MKSDQLDAGGSLEALYLSLNEWRFRMRAYRLFLCIELLVLGLPYLVLVENYEVFTEVDIVWKIFLVAVLLLMPFLVFWRSKVNPQIAFFKNHIEVPRFFFWVRRISTDSILSLEEMKIKKIEFGVLIGLRNGAIINYEESTFQNGIDYLRFKQSVNRILEKNKKSVNINTIKVEPLSLNQNALLILISSIFLMVFLHLTSDHPRDFYTSLEVGALSKVVLSGEQFYRVASSFFLHLNNFHISMNIAAIALFGQFLLRVVDLYRFVCILLLSAFLASILTLTLSPYAAIIGASGGIMGVFGAYCCLKLLRYLPGSISSSSNVWILVFIAVQVALEYFVEGIDSYTHAGGFLTGFVYMWFCLKYEEENSVFRSSTAEKVTACVLALFYLSGLLIFFLKIYGNA